MTSRLIIRDLGRTHYEAARTIQLDLHREKREHPEAPDYVLITEHEPVLTLGRKADTTHLLRPEDAVRRGIPLIRTERGGNITYHGPGQLIVYPIFDLKRAGWSVSRLIHCLEEIGIRLLAGYGIRGRRSPVNRGIYVEGRKIGFIGLAIRNRISFHGLSLNIDPDLSCFSLIRPCGLEGIAVTSLAREIRGGAQPDMTHAREQVCPVIREMFGER